MPTAGQGGTQGNIRTGAHAIEANGTKVGYTEGSLTFSWNVQTRQRFVAEWGTSPIATLVTGLQPTVVFRVIERTLALMDIIMHGLHPTTVSSNGFSGRGLGRSGIISSDDFNKELRLHPIAESDQSRDIILHRAILYPTGTLELSDQGDQIVEVSAFANIDDSLTDGQALLHFLEATS